MQEYESIITEKGQVTIPQELLHTIGLKPGDKVRMEADGGAIKLTRVPSEKRSGDFQEMRKRFHEVTGEKAASEGM